MLKLDSTKVYKLIAVTDKNGLDKANSRSLYKERINCIATNLRYDTRHTMYNHEYLIVCVDFIQDEKGGYINRQLNTSQVYEVVAVENGIDICTQNSIYTFIEAEIIPPVYQCESNLIELYLSMEREDRFVKGFYYNENKIPRELSLEVRLGMFFDSVFICYTDEEKRTKYICRYFTYFSGIEFCNTTYDEQAYSMDILIHNVGNYSIEVKSKFLSERCVIKAGESKRLT